MANEKLINSISAIERALGKIEGVAFVLEDRYANPLLDAVEVIDSVVSEIANTDTVEQEFKEDVVKCRDCEHYDLDRLECHNVFLNGINGMDGWCNHGERKKEDGK